MASIRSRARQLFGGDKLTDATRQQLVVMRRMNSIVLSGAGGGFSGLNSPDFDVLSTINPRGYSDFLGGSQREDNEVVYVASQARDLVMHNGYAHNIVSQFVRNVACAEVYKPRFNDDVDESPAMRLTDEWCKYISGMNDASGCSIIDAEQSALYSVIVDGDALMMTVGDGTTHFAGRDISDIDGGAKAMKFNGVEFDENGRHIRYVVENPYTRLRGGTISYLKIDARRVNYLCLRRELGVVRARSWLAPALIRLAGQRAWDNNLMDVLDTITKTPYVLQTISPDTYAQLMGDTGGIGSDTLGIGNVGGDDLNNMSESTAIREIDELNAKMRTALRARNNIHRGGILEMPLNKQLIHPEHKIPSQTFINFREVVLKEVIAAVGLSQTAVMNSAGNAGNFSSARQDKINDVAIYNALRSWWGRVYRKPLWQSWLRMQIISGWRYDKLSRDAIDKLMNPKGWTRRGDEWVDPVKDAQAKIMLMSAGLVSPVQAAEELGVSLEEVKKGVDKYESLFGVNPVKPDTMAAGIDGTPGMGGGDDDDKLDKDSKGDKSNGNE